MVDNVTVIIRSSEERTSRICHSFAAREVEHSNLILIKEAPFYRALEKTLSLGLERNLPWTLALDADVLQRPKAIESLLKISQDKDPGVFVFKSMVLDKMFHIPRSAGVHLYRTRFIGEALDNISRARHKGRPESFIIRCMKNKGHGTEFLPDFMFGLHDYEQNYRDIYRKGFQHSLKHGKYRPYFERLWRRLGRKDPDYKVALAGYYKGLDAGSRDAFDSDKFKTEFPVPYEELGLSEKPPLNESEVTAIYVNKIIEQYKGPREYRLYEDIVNNRFNPASLRERFIRKILRWG